MQDVIVPERRFHTEQIAPGIVLERLYPGGKDGPNREVLLPYRGGQTWAEIIRIGSPSDGFQMAFPDIRLPVNQMIPMHWHDCWTAVVIAEGECLIGDWWMQAGDVFIAAPSIEYGPLMMGPQGCRLFEIFAQDHLSLGGYAPEYRGFPTVHVDSVFLERSALNRHNAGRAIIPSDGEGQSKGHLSPGARWELGDRDDPDRGLLTFVVLAPGEQRPARDYGDWGMIVVMGGALSVGGRTLQRDDALTIRPRARLGDLVAGAEGAKLLELSRTTRA